MYEECFKLSQNAVSRNVKENGKVITDTHLELDQDQNLITSRESSLAYAYRVWSTSINIFLSYLADRKLTHTHTHGLCHYILDNNCNNNCPITIIFPTLITPTMCHQKVVSLSHITYLMQLSYPGKQSNY